MNVKYLRTAISCSLSPVRIKKKKKIEFIRISFRGKQELGDNLIIGIRFGGLKQYFKIFNSVFRKTFYSVFKIGLYFSLHSRFVSLCYWWGSWFGKECLTLLSLSL